MKTALIIEDNAEIRENTAEILELAGYHVISAVNGKDGVLTAIQKMPGIILCDIMMPEMNGYEVLKVLKATPLVAKIPFIYITASTEKSEIQQAMDLGADGYVRKPFDVKELMDAIHIALLNQ
jgi:CheY-like chemotaxis protein